jgi:tetratricopeptide (TPR) repeat protein
MNCSKILVRLACALVFALQLPVALAQYHDPRALAANPLTNRSPIAPRLTGLGDVSMRVTTRNANSQYFFDQGMRLTYAFNHSEALRSFKEAARLDNNNAMAWWGQALVLGPNINLPMMPYVTEQAWGAIRTAQSLKRFVTAKEATLIDALAARYSSDPDADRAQLNQAYADAMTDVLAEYSFDPDVATLYASAIMNLSPWDYWRGDGSPYGRTETVLQVLEDTINGYPIHTGALHYYIHITESVDPARGEGAADLLDRLAPGAGHLVHMPSHIYMRRGRYADSYRINVEAAKADESYIAQCQAQGLYAVGYYPHNMHFLVWSAQILGRRQDALNAARKIQSRIGRVVDETAPMPTGSNADAWLLFETFLSQPLYTMVRFGQWGKVLTEPKPDTSARFMTGVWHYARGLAFVHTGKARKSRRELKALRKVLSGRSFREYPASLNGAVSLLQIGEQILAGEIAAAKNDYNEAIAYLSTAVRLQDGIVYMEPPDWYFPSRHYLGAILLEAGRPAEAETVYWQDLRKNPVNGYALIGLQQAQLAQGQTDRAAETANRLKSAWSQADVKLTNSRY